jgi:UDP-N-acetyl-alpha-D-quinovosamine dehydrogenase
VIHAAGWAGNPKSFTAAQHQIDPITTQRLCSAAANAGVEHFVLISSVKAIGAQTHEQPFDEFTPPRPKDIYGATKLQSERALSEVHEIAKTIIRLPAIYGPEMKGGMLTLFALASHHIPMPLKGLQNERDFLSLISMSDFVAKSVEHPPETSETERTLLVCDGRPVSSSELYDLISRSLGLRSIQFGIPEVFTTAAAASNSGSMQSLFGSLRVNDAWSRDQLQWTPPIDFEEALYIAATWYRARTA